MRIYPKTIFMALSVSMLFGCSADSPTSVKTENSHIAQTTVTELPQDKPLLTLGDDSIENESLQSLHISASKVECQGFHLSLCFLSTPDANTVPEYLYEAIEGFEYQWGYEYELLVSVSSVESRLSDTSDTQYELVSITSQSSVQQLESFNHIARFNDESLVKVSDGEYLLAGIEAIKCDSSVCESIDAAIAQDQAMLLDIQYGSNPSEPLNLVSVLCVESRSAFNSACLVL